MVLFWSTSVLQRLAIPGAAPSTSVPHRGGPRCRTRDVPGTSPDISIKGQRVPAGQYSRPTSREHTTFADCEVVCMRMWAEGFTSEAVDLDLTAVLSLNYPDFEFTPHEAEHLAQLTARKRKTCGCSAPTPSLPFSRAVQFP